MYKKNFIPITTTVGIKFQQNFKDTNVIFMFFYQIKYKHLIQNRL